MNARASWLPEVRKAWATAEDVYGGRSHPPKAGGYAAQAGRDLQWAMGAVGQLGFSFLGG